MSIQKSQNTTWRQVARVSYLSVNESNADLRSRDVGVVSLDQLNVNIVAFAFARRESSPDVVQVPQDNTRHCGREDGEADPVGEGKVGYES